MARLEVHISAHISQEEGDRWERMHGVHVEELGVLVFEFFDGSSMEDAPIDDQDDKVHDDRELEDDVDKRELALVQVNVVLLAAVNDETDTEHCNLDAPVGEVVEHVDRIEESDSHVNIDRHKTERQATQYHLECLILSFLGEVYAPGAQVLLVVVSVQEL